MLRKPRIILLMLIAGVLMITAFAFSLNNPMKNDASTKTYIINEKWELPEELNEISGMAWVSNNIVACIQDEDGVIFLYNLENKKVIERIEFGEAGDYEGIAVNDKNAYVLRSDGVIHEVKNFKDDRVTTTQFKTDFSAKNNMETLAMNSKTNSLIIAPKDRDLKDDNFKGLYEISLNTREMNIKPFIRIDMNDKLLRNFRAKKIYKTFNPSDLAIHPKTEEMYILEGKKPKLLILNKDGLLKSVHVLDKEEFAQPEAITFSPEGKLYIGNEAGDDSANILEVQLSKLN